MVHLGRQPRTQPSGRNRPGRGSKARRITRDGVPWSDLPRIDACTIAAELCAPSRQLRHVSLALQRAACLAVLAVGRGAVGVAAMDVRAALGLAEAKKAIPACCFLAVSRWCRTGRSCSILQGASSGGPSSGPGASVSTGLPGDVLGRPIGRACGGAVFGRSARSIRLALVAACVRVGARPLTETEWRSARWLPA